MSTKQTAPGSYKKRSLWRNAAIRLKRNRRAMVGLVFLVLLVVVALLAPVIAPEGYDAQDIDNALIKPCAKYPLGTDNLGRNILSRIIWGSRISLRLGIISVAISLTVGGLIGAISGFYGGRLDNMIMRMMDIVQAIPNILLAIAIASALGSGIENAMIAVGISGIPGYARLMRGSVLSIRDSEYVEAAHAITASNPRIICKHIIPNAMSPMIVQATMGVASSILVAAALSFIGLGAQAPVPEWGAMVSAGRNYILNDSYLVIFPGLAIMVTVIALNLLGDGVRDALDPRLSR